MRIPFDIKYRPQIESGEYKVETRDGRRVRVLCWDRAAKEDQPKDLKLCVLVPENGGEAVYYYYSDGTKWVKDACFDLFIITPEPKLTEFEDALKDCVNMRGPENPMTDEGARNNATILRAIAFKEFKKNEAYYMKECVEQKEKEAYERGKAEALKNLPRWRKCDRNTIYNTKFNLVENGVGRFLMVEGYQIDIDSLEDLPGFKED